MIPDCFKGLIGQAITGDIYLLPMVKFVPISGRLQQLPESVLSDLSYDQRYLYEISIAVTNWPDKFPTDLLHVKVGALNHARWLTLGNRILRLYVSTIKPTAKLKRLASFILKVYSPCWF